MDEIMSFEEAIEATQKNDRSLLLGNGFSARYFAYSNLLEKSGLEERAEIRNLFRALDTVDFKVVMRSLEDAATVELAYDNEDHARELTGDAEAVRRALVEAVRETHPFHREDLAFNYESSAAFIRNFGTVFTLNYDLLLYWVNLERGLLRDGFGLGSEDDGFHGPFTEEAYCEIYNLHGGLHLFVQPDGGIAKRINAGDGVIASIENAILNSRKLPLYVAEGTWQGKMRKINSVAYLRHCYDKLRKNSATLFIYGHSASDNDSHIYKAIFSSNVKSIYFGIYKPSEESFNILNGQLARFQKLGKNEINYHFFDADSANVWGNCIL